MRYAIISDIHANLEALEKVAESIEEKKIDHIICLGDLVGYGPNPKECIEYIHNLANIVLAGNHDYAAVGLTDTNYFNYYAKTAVEWTSTLLNPQEKLLLANAPLTHEKGPATFVHATPREPAAWDYIMSLEDALANFKHFESQVCFIGHSHVPVVLDLNGMKNCKLLKSTSVTLEPGHRYIINVGSVGQPRDRDIRASFGIFDDDMLHFELVRIEYPVKITQSKIIQLNLPLFLAERLGKGI